MPTYDYKCNACSHRFEHFQSMKDAPLRKCPSCGKNALERLIGTGAAVLFKGSGFYQTDYRSESYNAAKKADSGSSSGTSDAGKAEAGKGAAATPAGPSPSAAAGSPAKSAEPAKPAEPKAKPPKPDRKRKH